MGEPKIRGGYILLSRRLIESEIFKKPPLYLKVWVYLLSRAQHKNYKGLKAGQLRTSIPEIMEACSHYVGCRKVVPTKDQIFQILEFLRTPSESNAESNTKATSITTTKATQGLLINIDNYRVYQSSSNYESNTESNVEKVPKATSNPDNINKNDTRMNNIYIDDFEELWRLYPRKEGKAKAKKSYEKLRQTYSREELMRCVERYALKVVETERQYIKHGSTFFNGGYEDYLDANYINDNSDTSYEEDILY